MLTRRSVLFGLLAAPAIIKTPGLLMPVKKVIVPPKLYPYQQEIVDWLATPLPPGVYAGTMKNFLIQSQNAERAIARIIFEINDAPQSPHWVTTSIEL